MVVMWLPSIDTDEAARSHWKVRLLPVGAASVLSGAARVIIELTILAIYRHLPMQ
jgi:hypothetical protein